MAYVPLSAQAVFAKGYPVDGARVFAFDTLTTMPRTLYLSSDLDPARVHPWPVVAIDGVLPPMWAGQNNYDLAIYYPSPNDGLIRRIVGLRGDAVAATASGAFNAQAQITTGDVLHSHRTGRRDGWVRCNGLTIGSSASAATERAADDCHALFVFLWAQDPNLLVTGGRSAAGAEADWALNKVIALPNDQNRFDLGIGDMGNAGAAASITGGLAPNGTILGATGGEAAHALTAAEVGTAGTQAGGAVAANQATGGAAHNTLPPFIARMRYLKL